MKKTEVVAPVREIAAAQAPSTGSTKPAFVSRPPSKGQDRPNRTPSAVEVSVPPT